MVGAFLFYDLAEFHSVKHREYMAAVGHLHGGSLGVFVARHYFDSHALELYCNFLAQLAATQQQGLAPRGRHYRSYFCHFIIR